LIDKLVGVISSKLGLGSTPHARSSAIPVVTRGSNHHSARQPLSDDDSAAAFTSYLNPESETVRWTRLARESRSPSLQRHGALWSQHHDVIVDSGTKTARQLDLSIDADDDVLDDGWGFVGSSSMRRHESRAPETAVVQRRSHSAGRHRHRKSHRILSRSQTPAINFSTSTSLVNSIEDSVQHHQRHRR
jgi:hypothetical protein